MTDPDFVVPFAVQLLMEAARKAGFSASVLDPEFGYLWELSDGAGWSRAVVGAKLPINDASAGQIAGDKHYCAMVLERHGFRVPISVRALSPRHFRSTRLADRTGTGPALEFARSCGYPLIVKPNRLSHGRRVVRVDSDEELVAAVESVFELDTLALVQECVEGQEFRLDFVDGEYLTGYQRLPARVVGDGEHTIQDLLGELDPRFRTEEWWEEILESEAWRRCAAPRGLELETVLTPGDELTLDATVMNLNRGCVAQTIDELPEAWIEWCGGVGRALGLRFFGIDLRVGSLESDPREAVILEVNATPLLAQMAKMGQREAAVEAQARVVSALRRPSPFRGPRATVPGHA